MAHEGDPNYTKPTIPGSGGKLAFTPIPDGPIFVDQEGDVKEDDLSEKAFAGFAKSQLESVIALLQTKGDQYSGETNNALVNFIEGSAMVGQTPANYLMSLGTKHWHSLGLWSSGKAEKSADQIVERAKDIIVYMLLLIWMIKTNQTKR